MKIEYISCFGYSKQQVFGYNVKNLLNEIGGILVLFKEYKMIIIGEGNIGKY